MLLSFTVSIIVLIFLDAERKILFYEVIKPIALFTIDLDNSLSYSS